MIYLDNCMLWDGELSPTRIPRIAINPDLYKTLNAEERWIRCGKWKVRISVEPDKKGFRILGRKNNTVLGSGEASGSLFVDDSMIEIAPYDTKTEILGGKVSGCFDVSWD